MTRYRNVSKLEIQAPVISNNVTLVTSEGSNQTAHRCSLDRAFS